ncbi:MAG: response regulator [Elusimicrobiota bacterium]
MARVLLIESDDILRCALKRALAIDRHEVDTAATLSQARALIEASPAYDFFVTEWHFDDGYGRDIIKDIRRRQPLAKIMVMTGFPVLENQLEALSLEVDDYLGKPFDVEEFLAALRRLSGEGIHRRSDVRPQGYLLAMVQDSIESDRALIRCLRLGGFMISLTSDPLAALAKINVSMPLAAIVDVGLGEEKGLDLIRRIRALGAERPAIVLLSDEPEKWVRQTWEMGVDLLVGRSALPYDFRRQIERLILERWSLKIKPVTQ